MKKFKFILFFLTLSFLNNNAFTQIPVVNLNAFDNKTENLKSEKLSKKQVIKIIFITIVSGIIGGTIGSLVTNHLRNKSEDTQRRKEVLDKLSSQAGCLVREIINLHEDVEGLHNVLAVTKNQFIENEILNSVTILSQKGQPVNQPDPFLT